MRIPAIGRPKLLRLVVAASVAGSLASTAAVSHAATAVSVAAGASTTCAIDDAGGAWCWGRNQYGQLGDGSTTDRLVPVPVSGLASGVTAISPGDHVTCAIVTGGGVKCWGRNAAGGLGDGTGLDSATPVDVAGLASGVVAIATGDQGACALTSGGGVKCWGSNTVGQVGDGSTTNRPTPVDVTGLTSGVVAIAHGGAYACALTSAGAVKCWGFNLEGQLGDGTINDSNVPVQVSGLTSGVADVRVALSVAPTTCALTTVGGVKCWGGGDGPITTPTDVPALASGVQAISVGGDVVMALLTGGAVKAVDPRSTETSAPDVGGLHSGIAALAGGASQWSHGCVLTSAGEIKCWGKELSGELGENGTGSGAQPGCVVGFGDDDLDHICESADVCTAGLGFAASPVMRLQLGRFNADPVPGDDTVKLRGRFALPPALAFGDLDPQTDGARLTMVDPGGIVFDRTFPPGVYAGRGTAGWTRNATGRKWTFTDATPSSGPVKTRITLADKAKGALGGLVDVTLHDNGQTLPDVPNGLPIQATFVPGDTAAGAAGTCYQTGVLTSCRANAKGTSLICLND